MAKTTSFYVYIVFRPNGQPCYVGKGSGLRWREHFKRSHNAALAEIIAQAGGDVPIIKIREGLTNAEACEIEIELIYAIGRECHGGPLVNKTDGGEGIRNPDPAVRKAANEKLKAYWTQERREAMSAKQVARFIDPEIRRAHAKKQKICMSTPEARRNLSKAHIGKTQSPETIEKRISQLRGRKRPAHVIEALRAYNTGRVVSEETRRKLSEKNTGYKLSPEAKAKCSAAATKRWDKWRADNCR